MSTKYDFKKIFELLGKMEQCANEVSRLNAQLTTSSHNLKKAA
ncbi:hypothetical protein [Providencia heimbachae]|nr:hypothetical protein [Providencia heimbachae]